MDTFRNEYSLNYEDISSTSKYYTYEHKVLYLLNILPRVWIDKYKKFKFGSEDIVELKLNTFLFVYDCNTSINVDGIPRVIAAYGLTNPSIKREDDSRLQGWIGPTEKFFGKEWDKGHFIANSIGGVVDGFEFNVFPQNRRLNRGWSREGKVYREMEEYCKKNSGVFCFHRPIYLDASHTPNFLEFGILGYDGKWRVNMFNNYNSL